MIIALAIKVMRRAQVSDQSALASEQVMRDKLPVFEDRPELFIDGELVAANDICSEERCVHEEDRMHLLVSHGKKLVLFAEMAHHQVIFLQTVVLHVPVYKLAGGEDERWVRADGLVDFFEVICGYLIIGVYKGYPFGRHHPKSSVASGPGPRILLADVTDFAGMALLPGFDHLGGVVGGAIIHENNFNVVGSACLAKNAFKIVVEIVLHVVYRRHNRVTVTATVRSFSFLRGVGCGEGAGYFF